MLLIVTRRMGDVLLASPIVRSIRAAWPEAAIDVLVFDGTKDVLAAHPDVRRVLTVPERPGVVEHVRFLFRLLRNRYDIALSCLASDRPTLYAVAGGRWRAGLVVPGRASSWKYWFLSRPVAFDNVATHTVAMNLALTDALNVARRHDIDIRWSADDAARVASVLSGVEGKPYAALHVHPKFNYKMWHVEGWVGLAQWLRERGVVSVLTGGTERGEVEYAGTIAGRMPTGTINLAGQLTLAQSACVIAGARVYVGPDTVTTHMAAAIGVPTVALYGPSNPVKWGPWPKDFAGTTSPWQRVGSQSMGNVVLVQGVGACVPCMREGCDQHVASFSECLRQLPLPMVTAAVERALEARRSS